MWVIQRIRQLGAFACESIKAEPISFGPYFSLSTRSMSRRESNIYRWVKRFKVRLPTAQLRRHCRVSCFMLVKYKDRDAIFMTSKVHCHKAVRVLRIGYNTVWNVLCECNEHCGDISQRCSNESCCKFVVNCRSLRIEVATPYAPPL